MVLRETKYVHDEKMRWWKEVDVSFNGFIYRLK